MSEIESAARKGKVRKCAWCRNGFEAKLAKQLYCKKKCYSKALRARRKDRQGLEEDRGGRIVPSQLLFELQNDRDRLSMQRLEVLVYLETRAGVVEAEEQLRQWSKRLADRRARLLDLEEPPLTRHVQLLRGDEALVVPGRTTAIGIVSTDGIVGVAIYGTPR